MLAFAADIANREHRDVIISAFLQQWHREIAVALQRRLARMIRAYLRAQSHHEARLLRGAQA